MLTARHLTDQMSVAMDDFGFAVFNGEAAYGRMNPDPCDRVLGPVEPGMIFDDRQIHRHENPALIGLPSDMADDVWI